MRHSAGFTLIELMVTIAVAAVLMTIAAPSLEGFVIRNRLASTSNDLASAMAYARSEAVMRGTQVVVCSSDTANAGSPSCAKTDSWAKGWLVFVDENANNGLDTGELILRTFAAAQPGIAVTPNAANTFGVRFGRTGKAEGIDSSGTVATGPSFGLCHPNSGLGRSIVLSSSGRVSSNEKTPC